MKKCLRTQTSSLQKSLNHHVFLSGGMLWYKASYTAAATKSFPFLSLGIFIDECHMLSVLGQETLTGVQCVITSY